MNYPNNGLLTLDFTNVHDIFNLEVDVIKEETKKQLFNIAKNGTAKLIVLMFAVQCLVASLSDDDVSIVVTTQGYQIALPFDQSEIYEPEYTQLAEDKNLQEVVSFLQPFEDELLTTTDKSGVTVTDAEISRLVEGLTKHLRLSVSGDIFTIAECYNNDSQCLVYAGGYTAILGGTAYYIEINKTAKTLSTTVVEA